MENFDLSTDLILSSLMFLVDDGFRLLGSHKAIIAELPPDDSLFHFLSYPGLARQISGIKCNDPKVTSLELGRFHHLCEEAGGRLGCILGQNTYVEALTIWNHNLDVADTERLSSFAPFFSHIPSLKDISLKGCNLGPASINLLTNALSSCSNTIEKLDLSNNNIVDIDLGQFVDMRSLALSDNDIGLKGCTSLAKLLRNHESKLESLYLSHNAISNESAIILTDSLSKNTKLSMLWLDRNKGITNSGWLALLKLIFNSSSINNAMQSNHTLSYLGMRTIADIQTVDLALGIDDANLLHASLGMNAKMNKTSVARQKILCSHARGNLNLGGSSIVTGLIPRILAWIGDHSYETFADVIQCHQLPFPKARLDTIRLDAVLRFVRDKPDLCSYINIIPDNLEACQRGLQYHWTCARRMQVEIMDLRDEIKCLKAARARFH